MKTLEQLKNIYLNLGSDSIGDSLILDKEFYAFKRGYELGFASGKSDSETTIVDDGFNNDYTYYNIMESGTFIVDGVKMVLNKGDKIVRGSKIFKEPT